MRSRRSWMAGVWPPRQGDRPRVLVENADGAEQWALEGILGQAGYEVAVCAGPDGHHHQPCPLVATGSCALAEGADVIVNSLRLRDPRNRDVVTALRDRLPDVPVVVEVPRPEAARDASLFEGCQVVGRPMTGPQLVAEVARVLDDR